MTRALVIDDDIDFRTSLAHLVRNEGFDVIAAGSLSEAREHLGSKPELILTDLGLPDGQGIDVFADIAEGYSPDVVIVTGQASLDTAVQALRSGALDYLTKPLDIPRLKTVLANVLRTRALKEEIGSLRGELRKLGRFGGLIGASDAMQRVYDHIAKVGPTSASVFITGESGTGKELVAQNVHEMSRRKRQLFLPINCGAIQSTLIESELFGHERGSFTGANQLRRGHFERASGGTLFLDEITEMPVELQVKLLRVLESGTLMRLGGSDLIPVDVRVIAATNRPPDQAVQDGKLRADLYYRLNVFPIPIPPLRERSADIVVLAEYFLDQLNRAEGTTKRLSPAGRARISSHNWPGNVRELKNEVHRAYILADDVLEFEGLAQESVTIVRAAPETGPVQTIRVGTPLAEVERRLILSTLESCGGDKRKASAMLGISLKTLYNRINLYAAGVHEAPESLP